MATTRAAVRLGNARQGVGFVPQRALVRGRTLRNRVGASESRLRGLGVVVRPSESWPFGSSAARFGLRL